MSFEPEANVPGGNDDGPAAPCAGPEEGGQGSNNDTTSVAGGGGGEMIPEINGGERITEEAVDASFMQRALSEASRFRKETTKIQDKRGALFADLGGAARMSELTQEHSRETFAAGREVSRPANE
uniref:Uncharacterized protein n=1 Tax=Hemiselmis andersenii TaxID=464988 RepID=A0A6U4Q8S1_HEMAN|mmetsp:Transcript_3713/g.8493  ORF Transcript_3713/g.8493 Transcript_3713/m.8493 type:complete len:125 (-) Transcript_3713:378-752(-)|eukprot:CAMPEP_0172019068 /NCGR_PEP_ID=MMETSP1041-20130122/12442_1 /TAXON_ID=464988 /ORGANISM="Hemiselmis andersenii, Strain CCMP439" /LENGTH=124 /DNA_ID=CAMNT_0012674223 /DNA_START=40 /DNA_END=414 /DNA_ORIENTATION=+